MIKENQKLFNALLALSDAVICFISMALAFYIRFSVMHNGNAVLHFDYYLRLLAAIIPGYFFLYGYLGLHDSFRNKGLVKEISKVFQGNFIGVIGVFLLVFFLKDVDVSRLVILLFAALNTLLTSAERYALRKLLRSLRKRGYNLKHVVFVGWTENSGEFYDKISKNKELGYQVVGFVAPAGTKLYGRKLKHLGGFSELPVLLNTHFYDEAIISLDESQFSILGELIDACEKAGIKSSLLPFYTKYLPSRPVIDDVDGTPLINVRRIPLDNFIHAFTKRSFDIVCSVLGLLILSPFLAVIAAGVKFTSPGPVLYKQVRIGRNKREFLMYKFRSMAVSADGSDMTTWGTSGDTRRTKYGAFLRKFSIDELPQLWNVLKGDMSLVGPRPERPFFVSHFKEEIPLYMLKHLVRPGITGWAQINGWRGDTDIAERIQCDVYYIENWSFLLDIKILLLTLFKGLFNTNET